jgi:pimeloyl-ACP methyl ester carboxylesterase
VRADPIVFFMGGPSYPAIDAFSVLGYFDHTAYTKHRDLILVDLRGTRSSRPFLHCPEFDRLEAATWPNEPTQAQRDRSDRACRTRLAGIADLRHYGSVDTAKDARDLRKALGYGRWNVMAFSAGGEPALQYLRIDPDGIRAAVLDAPVTSLSRPSATPWYPTEAMSRMVGQLFAGCASQPACAKAFPDLKARFWHEVDRLNRHPLLVHIPVAGGGSVRFRVSGYFFQQDIVAALGDIGLLPYAPALLDDLLRNGIEPLYDFTIGPPFPLAPFLAEGRTIAYRCREFAAFQTRATTEIAMQRFPRWRRVALDEFRGTHHQCSLWQVGRDPVVRNPVESDVPTLLFQGEWDDSIPNPPIDAAARHLKNGTLVKVPGVGHGSLASYGGWQACPRSVATAFLHHPTAPVDTTCVGHMPHIVFRTSLPSAGSLGSTLRSAVDRCGDSAYSPAGCSFRRRW